MLYLYCPEESGVYLRLFQEKLPDWKVVCWPEPVDPACVTHVAAWGAPPGFFADFCNLRVVFNLGAGVDALLRREDIPAAVEVVRLTDAGMAQQMIEYCLYGVLHYQREMDHYRLQQAAGQWRPRESRFAGAVRVSVLGLGELGRRVARALSGLGYPVRAWSRQARQVEGVECRHGEAALDFLLEETDVLFCVLPATAQTRHLLDARRLSRLPKGAAIINAGRGSLIDEAALLDELNRERLRFAMLDVFATEPLPGDHPFWQHPRVIMTPHVAADTVPAEAVTQIAANLRREASGQAKTGRVDRLLGY